MSIERFNELRYGMFIHWGVYSVFGGEYKGMTVPWVAEWIMNKFHIPVAEYTAAAANFNPVNFNADEWVRKACDAGMKYIIFTAKHHDGFCMFKSTYDNYNIVDATPFKRDVVRELADACRKYGLKLGCYYSQDLDWHEEGATGNVWDFKAENKTPEAFQKYLDTKVKHQLRELLTNYGELLCIWFDMPVKINKEQSLDLNNFVKSIQPDCLVSGRVGNDIGDYISLGDNLPADRCYEQAAEGMNTMNESWGYKKADKEWRNPTELFRNLAQMVSHNANHLINVGPLPDGTFPAEADKILAELGKLAIPNIEAITGAHSAAKLFTCTEAFPWGELTSKGNNIYLWIFRKTSVIDLYGIRNKVVKAEILSSGEPVKVIDERVEEYNYCRLIFEDLPPIETPFIIKVELDGAPQVFERIYDAGFTRF